MAQTFVSFKNVGVREHETRLVTVVSQSVTPIGIKTPVAFGTADGLFQMNMTLSEQIQDNLRNLIQTNHGERLVLFDYGANLRPLVTEFSNEDAFDSEAMVRINTAVSKYMNFVQLEGYASQPVFDGDRYTGIVKIALKYSVPRANIGTRILEVTLFVI